MKKTKTYPDVATVKFIGEGHRSLAGCGESGKSMQYHDIQPGQDFLVTGKRAHEFDAHSEYTVLEG